MVSTPIPNSPALESNASLSDLRNTLEQQEITARQETINENRLLFDRLSLIADKAVEIQQINFVPSVRRDQDNRMANIAFVTVLDQLESLQADLEKGHAGDTLKLNLTYAAENPDAKGYINHKDLLELHAEFEGKTIDIAIPAPLLLKAAEYREAADNGQLNMISREAHDEKVKAYLAAQETVEVDGITVLKKWSELDKSQLEAKRTSLGQEIADITFPSRDPDFNPPIVDVGLIKDKISLADLGTKGLPQSIEQGVLKQTVPGLTQLQENLENSVTVPMTASEVKIVNSSPAVEQGNEHKR